MGGSSTKNPEDQAKNPTCPDAPACPSCTGSWFVGFLVGIIVGVLIVLAIQWYLKARRRKAQLEEAALVSSNISTSSFPSSTSAMLTASSPSTLSTGTRVVTDPRSGKVTIHTP